jgi:O-antigen/teichoic acid export membrane protein
MPSDARSPVGPTHSADASQSAGASPARDSGEASLDHAAGRPRSMSRDLLSAYAASGAKVLSWAFLSAVVNRLDVSAFAILALVRSTLGLLNYTSLGLGPGMIRLLTTAGESSEPESPDDAPERETAAAMAPAQMPTSVAPADDVIPYAGQVEAEPISEHPSLRGYSNGVTVALFTGTLGLLVTVAYAGWFPFLHRLPPRVAPPIVLVLGMGVGTVLRLMSDAAGAVLQADGEIARDNLLLVLAEALWVVSAGAATWMTLRHDANVLNLIGIGYAVSGCALLLMRIGRASAIVGQLFPDWRLVTARALRFLVGFGSMVTVAQLADFLYAPTDFILINRLIDPDTVAAYAPAVQIDAGLLLLVGGMAAVVLPRTALAHAAGDVRTVREYYVRGTLASVMLLVPAALVVWVLAPWLLRAWLGRYPPLALRILPLVLIHTVVGGSSAVGRSVLLALGRVKPFTASVLIAGVANVILSYCFVHYAGWGLYGIVAGTLIAVIARCAIWTPWYTDKVLREMEKRAAEEDE